MFAVYDIVWTPSGNVSLGAFRGTCYLDYVDGMSQVYLFDILISSVAKMKLFAPRSWEVVTPPVSPVKYFENEQIRPLCIHNSECGTMATVQKNHNKQS